MNKIRERVRAVLAGSSDLLMTLVQVLVFFLVFLAILMLSFPKGTGLNRLYGELLQRQAQKGRVELGAGAPPKFIATLRRTTRQVKERAADEIAWRAARQGQELQDRHAIQTLDRSTASIVFDAHNQFELHENSLVIVRHPDRSRSSRYRSALVVLGGRIEGHAAPVKGRATPLDIVVGEAAAEVTPRDGAAGEFSVAVNPDQSATLQIYSGVGEVTLGGETAVLQPNTAITLFPDQGLGSVETIPGTPRLRTPADGYSETYGNAVPRIDFGWARANGARSYRFQISRDSDFYELVYEEDVSDPRATHGNLPAGRYYWRVVGLNGRAQGAASRVRSFSLVSDPQPPSLQVYLPEDVVRDDQLAVRGRTDVGARILVNGEAARVEANGMFEHRVGLRAGPNLIVVEASDVAGNVTYRSQYVNAKLERRQ